MMYRSMSSSNNNQLAKIYRMTEIYPNLSNKEFNQVY